MPNENDEPGELTATTEEVKEPEPGRLPTLDEIQLLDRKGARYHASADRQAEKWHQRFDD